ncbi:MAG: D-alanyl-D-alanine carboxypeptidase [Deltaproteobacteria bacterium]|nr:D-alanyl-D-alanine carboxypeptidase [Deltaproteobacteria bacterium]
MKKWLVMIFVFVLGTFLAQTEAAPRKKTTAAKPAAASKQTKSSKPAPPPAEPYKAFIVVEAVSGKVLEEENAHVKRAPASVVKLMVAYLVLDKVARGELKLTDTITATRDSSKIGGSQVYLKEGETFTLEEMMKAVMVASANDAAYAVAEHVAGTKEAFIQLMNEKAKALKMADTEFHSVHGLPPAPGTPEDQSSCADLAVLARELLKYPKILEWTSIPEAPFRGGAFIMRNHNKLLFHLPGTDGLKTGYYSETGFNVVATAVKNKMRFIVVVMGSPSAKIRDQVAMEKFKKAFAQYKVVDLVKKGEVIDKEIVLPDGKTGKIKGVAGADFSYPVPVNQKGAVTKEPVLPGKVSGEVKLGQKLGELVFKFDNQMIGKVDIVSPAAVPQANFMVRLLRKVGINL